MKYDKVMDKQCIPLCDALNMIPGIETLESCCGHNKEPFMIFFKAKHIAALSPILQEIDSGERWPWKIDVTWNCGTNVACFCLEGPIGAYKQANKLAKYISGRFARSLMLARL